MLRAFGFKAPAVLGCGVWLLDFCALQGYRVRLWVVGFGGLG